MPTVGQAAQWLRERGRIPAAGPVKLVDLHKAVNPVPFGSVRSMLSKLWKTEMRIDPWHPLYRRRPPAAYDAMDFASDDTRVELTKAHEPAFPDATHPGGVAAFAAGFDARTAAAISARTGLMGPPLFTGLLEWKDFHCDHPSILIAGSYRCLAAMAYPEYFPGSHAEYLWERVSKSLLEAGPGWCGTFGPGVDGLVSLITCRNEGNYDMTQMRLLPIAYRYYDKLSGLAREHLVRTLLALGRIHRPNCDDVFTSGRNPNDWSRAGFVSPLGRKIRIGETENHILMILTARYLSNQTLYQRTPDLVYDNRRNGMVKVLNQRVQAVPHCTELLLMQLAAVLADDFSEYNAKPYQSETRAALLNLCSYAYDHEVRLAARMVLDYISARIATSSNDLRRMVPFRRRNTSEHRRSARRSGGFMDVALLEWENGADPMAEAFAIQAGNLRAYETPSADRIWPWSIKGHGDDAVMEGLSDYRLPPAIHDLFVNDLHRRFFQRLHRVPQPNTQVTGRNCDNMEIYAGSPSYLITAGGSPATWAVFPGLLALLPAGRRENEQQLGVAVTTSFMPTVSAAGAGTQNGAGDLVQFGAFSTSFSAPAANYGVAPDFACGHQLYVPEWCRAAAERDSQSQRLWFVNKGSGPDRPGFYLAFIADRDFTTIQGPAVMEAFDTWLHPHLTFEEFKAGVRMRNGILAARGVLNNVEDLYTTENGNECRFVIWHGSERDGVKVGAKVLGIRYGRGDGADSFGDAGNITGRFLSGTVLNSPKKRVVVVTNPALGEKLTLDMRDPYHPRRVSEGSGHRDVESAGDAEEVWLDFASEKPEEGDFFRPYASVASAAAGVADGGVIKLKPGWTRERPTLSRGKSMRLVAPIGGVTIGMR